MEKNELPKWPMLPPTLLQTHSLTSPALVQFPSLPSRWARPHNKVPEGELQITGYLLPFRLPGLTQSCPRPRVGIAGARRWGERGRT